jgi:hypothetical protein
LKTRRVAVSPVSAVTQDPSTRRTASSTTRIGRGNTSNNASCVDELTSGGSTATEAEVVDVGVDDVTVAEVGGSVGVEEEVPVHAHAATRSTAKAIDSLRTSQRYSPSPQPRYVNGHQSTGVLAGARIGR